MSDTINVTNNNTVSMLLRMWTLEFNILPLLQMLVVDEVLLKCVRFEGCQLQRKFVINAGVINEILKMNSSKGN